MAYQIQDRYRLQYFTGTQASIWIGETWVAECFGISYSATQNIIPIFGYASSTFDAVARGRVLVQGSFEINFVDEGYLYYVLHEANAQRLRNPSNADEFNESQAILTGEPVLREAISRRLYELQQTIDKSDESQESQIAQDTLSRLVELNVNQIDRVIKELDIQRAIGASQGVRNGARSVIYDMIPFNLQGLFGNPEFTEEVTEKRLINCFLVSNEMIVSVDDEPLRERYSFIGQMHK